MHEQVDTREELPSEIEAIADNISAQKSRYVLASLKAILWDLHMRPTTGPFRSSALDILENDCGISRSDLEVLLEWIGWEIKKCDDYTFIFVGDENFPIAQKKTNAFNECLAKKHELAYYSL